MVPSAAAWRHLQWAPSILSLPRGDGSEIQQCVLLSQMALKTEPYLRAVNISNTHSIINTHNAKCLLNIKYQSEIGKLQCIMQAMHCWNTWQTLQLLVTWTVFGSRPSDHYFRSVCLSVCLCRVFLSCLWSDFDQTRTRYMSGSSCVP